MLTAQENVVAAHLAARAARRDLRGLPTQRHALAQCARWVEDPPPHLKQIDVHELVEGCFPDPEEADRVLCAARAYAAQRVGEMPYAKRLAVAAALRLCATDPASSDRLRHGGSE